MLLIEFIFVGTVMDGKKKFDIIMINDLLHYFTKEEKKNVLKNAFSALNEGGVLALTKFSLDFTCSSINNLNC